MSRDDNHRDLIALETEVLEGLHAVHARHFQIQQDQIGRDLADLLERGIAVGGFGTW